MATKRFRQGFSTTKINASTLSVLNIRGMQLEMSLRVRAARKPLRCQLTIFLGAEMLHGHTTDSPVIYFLKSATNGPRNLQGNKNTMRAKLSWSRVTQNQYFAFKLLRRDPGGLHSFCPPYLLSSEDGEKVTSLLLTSVRTFFTNKPLVGILTFNFLLSGFLIAILSDAG